MRIVVARWNEDLQWLAAYEDLGHSFFIVQKDLHIPNYGREPASFLWYITQKYESLAGEIAFVQGKPFDHCADLQELLAKGTDSFTWLGNPVYASNPDGSPHHHNLPVGTVAKRLGLNVAYPVTFAPGGQFIVTAERIKARPVEFYEECLRIILDIPMSPWAFERLWQRVFDA